MKYKVEKPPVIENNEDHNICALLCGECCKKCGCILHPYDVFRDGPVSYEKLKTLLNTGFYSLATYSGDPRDLHTWGVADYFKWDHEKHHIPKSIKLNKDDGLRDSDMFNDIIFIRVRNVFSPVVDFTDNDRGRCILLGDDGCNINFDYRPYGGKALVPHESYNDILEKNQVGCKIPNFMENAYKRWFMIQWIPYQYLLYNLYNEFRIH